jgi:hypothetical protein
MKTEPIRFSDQVAIRVSPAMTEQIAKLALARGTRPAEWCRNAIQLVIDMESGAAR